MKEDNKRLESSLFNRAIDRFLRYCAAERGSSANTRDSYRQDLSAFTRSCIESGKNSPVEIDALQLVSYFIYLRDKGLAPTSVARAQSAIKQFYSFLIEEGDIKEDPTENLHSPALLKKLPGVLSKEETFSILDQPDTSTVGGRRDSALFEVIYGAGLRVSEAINLEIESINFDIGIIRCLGKGSKERIVPVNNTALNAVRRYIYEPLKDGVSARDVQRKGKETRFVFFE